MPRGFGHQQACLLLAKRMAVGKAPLLRDDSKLTARGAGGQEESMVWRERMNQVLNIKIIKDVVFTALSFIPAPR